jgi:hypothetical protein
MSYYTSVLNTAQAMANKYPGISQSKLKDLIEIIEAMKADINFIEKYAIEKKQEPKKPSPKKALETLTPAYFNRLVAKGKTQTDIITMIKKYTKVVLTDILTAGNIEFSEKDIKEKLAEQIYNLYSNMPEPSKEEPDDDFKSAVDESDDEPDEEQEEPDEQQEEEEDQEAKIQELREQYTDKNITELRKLCKKNKIGFEKSDSREELISHLVEFEMNNDEESVDM